MAILDFLKNKEEREEAAKRTELKTQKPSPVKEVKKAAKPIAKKEEVKEVKVVKAEKITGRKDTTFSYEAIKQPHISEKATDLGQMNQYVFEVSPNYNKKELKRAIEGVYKVNVLSVNTIKIPPKKRRLGKTEGFRKKYKKAIVTIKEGQTIEIL